MSSSSSSSRSRLNLLMQMDWLQTNSEALRSLVCSNIFREKKTLKLLLLLLFPIEAANELCLRLAILSARVVCV